MAKEETGKIYKAMAAILKDIPAVPKGKRNEDQGYAFRGIDEVLHAVHDILAKHEVFVVPEVVGEARREERQTKKGGLLLYSIQLVKFTFYATDGSNISAIVEGEAMDTGDKATNKAMSAAMKYALIQTFCIPTEGDNDTENASPKPAPRKSPPPARKSTSSKPAVTGGRKPEEHIKSIRDHFNLFAEAYDDDRARAELIGASEFEKTDQETGEKTGEMVAGYTDPDDMEAKAKRRGLDKAAGRLRVICHIIEDSWKKALEGENAA